MRIAGKDKALDAQVRILEHALRDGGRIADERGTRPATHQADARPKVRAHLSLAAARRLKFF
jgi:hypothetical protein